MARWFVTLLNIHFKNEMWLHTVSQWGYDGLARYRETSLYLSLSLMSSQIQENIWPPSTVLVMKSRGSASGTSHLIIILIQATNHRFISLSKRGLEGACVSDVWDMFQLINIYSKDSDSKWNIHTHVLSHWNGPWRLRLGCPHLPIFPSLLETNREYESPKHKSWHTQAK